MHHKWNSLTKRQTKEVNPALFFAILGECTGTACSPRSTICTAIWKFQSLHGKLPDDAKQVDELENIANSLISEAEVNKQVLISEPRELLRYVFIHVVFERAINCRIAVLCRPPPATNFHPYVQ